MKRLFDNGGSDFVAIGYEKSCRQSVPEFASPTMRGSRLAAARLAPHHQGVAARIPVARGDGVAG